MTPRERQILRSALTRAAAALTEIRPMAGGERATTPGALARAMKALLEGQMALIEALSGDAPEDPSGELSGPVSIGAPDGTASRWPEPSPAAPPSTSSISMPEEAPAQRTAPSPPAGSVEPTRDPPPAQGRHDPVDEDFEIPSRAPVLPPPRRPKVRPRPSPALFDSEDEGEIASRPAFSRARPSSTPPAEAVPPSPAGEAGAAPGDAASSALDLFPLEDLNRWVASGTVFQIRGALAFLNMNSMGGGKIDEMRGHIRRMGFADELGRLEASGVSGAILLFRRPDA